MILALLALVAAASALTAYELRSRDEPARLRPIELQPPPERDERPTRSKSKPKPKPPSVTPQEGTDGGAAPVAPDPAPAGEPTEPSAVTPPTSGGDDDGDDDDDDDAGEDDGDDDD